MCTSFLRGFIIISKIKKQKWKETRIEPAGEPYSQVYLQTKLWPWKFHQLNSRSKRPGAWLEHVLAYCRVGRKYVGRKYVGKYVGRKYVGCIELLFKVYSAICRFYFLALSAFSVLSHCDIDLWRTDLKVNRINGQSNFYIPAKFH